MQGTFPNIESSHGKLVWEAYTGTNDAKRYPDHVAAAYEQFFDHFNKTTDFKKYEVIEQEIDGLILKTK